jgi:hypothetical protein
MSLRKAISRKERNRHERETSEGNNAGNQQLTFPEITFEGASGEVIADGGPHKGGLNTIGTIELPGFTIAKAGGKELSVGGGEQAFDVDASLRETVFSLFDLQFTDEDNGLTFKAGVINDFPFEVTLAAKKEKAPRLLKFGFGQHSSGRWVADHVSSFDKSAEHNYEGEDPDFDKAGLLVPGKPIAGWRKRVEFTATATITRELKENPYYPIYMYAKYFVKLEYVMEIFLRPYQAVGGDDDGDDPTKPPPPPADGPTPPPPPPFDPVDLRITWLEATLGAGGVLVLVSQASSLIAASKEAFLEVLVPAMNKLNQASKAMLKTAHVEELEAAEAPEEIEEVEAEELEIMEAADLAIEAAVEAGAAAAEAEAAAGAEVIAAIEDISIAASEEAAAAAVEAGSWWTGAGALV